MEDNKRNTQEAETANAAANEDKNAGKTFTQADLDALAGKIRSEERSKNEQAMKEAIAQAVAEERRQAKLTAEERENERQAMREAQLQAREERITLRERRLFARDLLVEQNIPEDLVDFVVDMDEEKTREKVEKFSQTYHKSVEKGVSEKLKGTPPADFSGPNPNTDRAKRVLSAF